MPKATRQFFLWLLLPCLVILISWAFSQFKLNEGHFVKSDGRGYYAYLPSMLLDHNLEFKHAKAWEEKRFSTVFANDYLHEINGRQQNKYFPGTALLLVPFYGVAAQLGFATTTGYETHFQYAVLIGAWMYFFLACTFSIQFLRSFHLNNRVIAATLLLGFFGTSLFHYTHFEPLMSHVYGFFAISGFLFCGRRFFLHQSHFNGIAMGFFLGLAALIRPTHLIIVLTIPLLHHPRPWKELYSSELLKKIWAPLLGFSIPMVVLFSIIFIQTRQFSLFTYSGEGFYFFNSKWMAVLFSFKKGLFVYAPVLSLGLASFFTRTPFSRVAFAAAFGAIAWVIGSWWNWYYGDSFGHRAFIDFYLLLFLPLGVALQKVGKVKPFFITGMTVFFTALTLFQNWQYRSEILHPFDMTKEKYFQVFGRILAPPVWQGGCDIVPYGHERSHYFYFSQTQSIALQGQGEKSRLPTLETGNYHYYLSGNIAFSEKTPNSANELFLVVQSYQREYWMAHPLKTFLHGNAPHYQENFCFVLPEIFANQLVEFSLMSNSGEVEVLAFEFAIEKIVY